MSSFIFYEPLYFEIDRLLNDPSLSKRGKSQAGCSSVPSSVRSYKPRLDLCEDTEKNLVTATFELPGFSKDEVQLNFQNGKLTVSAETKKSDEDGETGYSLRERRHGKFSRTLQLPQGIQDEQIKATMEDGLLVITFPKSSPELAPKKIVISDV